MTFFTKPKHEIQSLDLGYLDRRKLGFSSLKFSYSYELGSASILTFAIHPIQFSNVPGNGFSRVKVDRTDIKMKHILSKMVKKRGLKKAGLCLFLSLTPVV